jgi:hypothetical protein
VILIVIFIPVTVNKAEIFYVESLMMFSFQIVFIFQDFEYDLVNS